MISPLRPLWQAVAIIINSLGVNVEERQFPCVLVEQFNIRPSVVTKDAEDWTGTFLIEAVSKSESPAESITLIEQIQEVMICENIVIDGFTIQSIIPEELTPIQEIEDGIWRQLQRYRISLTKQQ